MNMPEDWPPHEVERDERKELLRQLEAKSIAEIEEMQALDAVRFGEAWRDATEWITCIARQHGFSVDAVRQGVLAGCREFWRWRLLENRLRANPIPRAKCQMYQHSVRALERSVVAVKARIDVLDAAPDIDFLTIEKGFEEFAAALKCASYDQRTVLAVGARTDLRVAAAALIQTVAEHAEKSGRKVRTNLNEFLFQALWLIDRSITYRLVEDLDRSAFVVMIDLRPDVSAA